MAPQKPSLGRVVIFVDGTHPERAATIAHVRPDGSVNLSVHDTDGSMFCICGVKYADDLTAKSPAFWKWPERI